jgi:tetratricopeptide (TPR) repeat protein
MSALAVAACALSACAGNSKAVIVNVLVPPEVTFGDHIKEVKIERFDGVSLCAQPLQAKVESLATNAELYRRGIAGLEEATETLEVRAKVETCTVRLGFGSLRSQFSVWHMGTQLRQEVISEQTNRPGAPEDEVRDVLVDRVAQQFARVFLPTSKKELRVFRPIGDNDAALVAAMNDNLSVAIDLWGKRLKDMPTDDRAYYNRGVAYEASGQLPAAIKDYRKAMELGKDELYGQALARSENALKAMKRIEVLRGNIDGR